MLGRVAGPFAADLEDHAGVEVREGEGGRFWAKIDVSESLQGRTFRSTTSLPGRRTWTLGPQHRTGLETLLLGRLECDY